jgi:hypothetical protein
MRVDVRTLWLIVEQFANGEASVETADEARVNRHTTDRLFRLLRAAIYQARTCEPIVLAPDDIAEMDEVYLTAGLKGHAGNLAFSCPAKAANIAASITARASMLSTWMAMVTAKSIAIRWSAPGRGCAQ